VPKSLHARLVQRARHEGGKPEDVYFEPDFRRAGAQGIKKPPGGGRLVALHYIHL